MDPISIFSPPVEVLQGSEKPMALRETAMESSIKIRDRPESIPKRQLQMVAVMVESLLAHILSETEEYTKDSDPVLAPDGLQSTD
jgi:hypothetical protein